jgi:hypothetical protein
MRWSPLVAVPVLTADCMLAGASGPSANCPVRRSSRCGWRPRGGRGGAPGAWTARSRRTTARQARIARLRQLVEVAVECPVPPGWVEEGSALVRGDLTFLQ